MGRESLSVLGMGSCCEGLETLLVRSDQQQGNRPWDLMMDTCITRWVRDCS